MSSFLFASPWGWLALAFPVAVVGLYLFHDRYRQRTISGFFLWEAPARSELGGRRIQPPTASRSFLLDLLASLLLAAACTAPSWQAHNRAAPVVVLDDSLSMQAGGADERVRQDALRLLHDQPAHRGAWVIFAGAKPRVLATPEDGRDVALQAVEGYRPFAPRCDMSTALALLTELPGAGSAEPHVFTDEQPEEAQRWNVAGTLHLYGTGGENVAFVSAMAEDAPRAGQVSVSFVLTNFSETARETVFRLWDVPSPAPVNTPQDNVPLAETVVALAPRERKSLSFSLPDGIRAVRGELSSPSDALLADSDVVLALRNDAPVRVRVAIPDAQTNAALLRAIRAAGGIPFIRSEPASVNPGDEQPETDLFDLDIVHYAPQRPASTAGLRLHLLEQGGDLSTLAGPFVIDLSHALCRDLDLEGVAWGCHDRISLPLRGIPLIQCGATPLLGFLSDRDILFNLSLARSNLDRSPAWPVFFHNLILYAKEQRGGLKQANYAPLEPVLWKTTRQSPDVPDTLSGEGFTGRLPDGAAQWTSPSLPGLYLFSHRGAPCGTIAVQSLSPAESDLSTRTRLDSLQVMKREDGKDGSEGLQSLTWLFALLALGCLLINWRLESREG